MPALSGEVILTLTDGTGAPVFIIYEFFDAVTLALRDVAQPTSSGVKTGALIVDNQTGKPQGVTVTDPDGGTSKAFQIPTTGVVFTVAQLAANKQNNGGPITSITDLNGISPTLT